MQALRTPPPWPRDAQGAIAVLSVHASPLGRLGRGENGGMNLAVRRLCEELSARGVPTDVFVRRDDPDAPSERLLAPGSRQVLLDAGPPRPVPKEEVLGHLPAFTAAVLAHAASERRRYRLLHSHYWLSGFAARRIAQRWEVPWVHSSHSLALLKADAGLPLDAERATVEEVVVKGADRLVAGSDAEAAALVSRYGASPEAVCVVPPGVDPGRFLPIAREPLRRRHGIVGRRTVLFAGRLEPLKGVDLLVEALAALTSRPGFEDVTLLLAGDESGDGRRQSAAAGGERARLAALVARHALLGNVRFLGAVEPDDLAALMVLADVVAVPSMTETFGLVALEAQAAGTPVVASAVGGLAETVVDGITGRLVAGRDPHRFADALGGILGDRAAATRMGEAGREHAAGFTWSASANRLLALYGCVETPDELVSPALCACL